VDLQRLIAHRAVRTYLDEPVPDHVVAGIVDAARWTGSARNRQPWRFVAVADDPTKRELARLGSYAAHLAQAPVVLVVLSPAERRLDTEFDVGRVVQSVVLAATAEGLGCGVVSLYPDDRSARAARLVGADSDWTARHAVALGRPGPKPTEGTLAIPRGRLPLEEVLSFR